MTLNQAVENTMSTIADYMANNKLALNQSKTKVMIVSRNNASKENFKVRLDNKDILHSSQATILGNRFSDNLDWGPHISNVLIPSLKNRIRTLRLVSGFLPGKFRSIYCNSIFRPKVMFGIETWGGSAKTLIAKIQSLQDQVSRISLSKEHRERSANQRQQILGWLPIHKEIIRATHVFTHKILNRQEPQELASLMPKNNKNLRISHHNKLATKPRWLGKCKLTRGTYRSRSYLFNTLPESLTFISVLSKLKKD